MLAPDIITHSRGFGVAPSGAELHAVKLDFPAPSSMNVGYFVRSFYTFVFSKLNAEACDEYFGNCPKRDNVDRHGT